ncbi:hypothetical protein LWI29_023538 [Acer saccharum]|uniref:F-box domain-containing protein n=1 Tax=Acer saccharum TaxID=4024 RepID=A0AA39W275_ACESA|nr:hypothetical protein LWI29_023538 [Acer saccharum]
MEAGVDGGDGDRLSSLPENIIRHIFSFLDSIDIVRASAVSRKWRYVWVSMPYLSVDIPYKMKFNDFVDWVLMFRNRLVDIQILRISGLLLEENHAFYRLMDVIPEFNLQELDLMIRYSRDKIELPQCIFNCGSLISLKLHIRKNCILKQHTFPGLSRLKSLDLCIDKFMALSIGNFVSSCPLLENLTVHGYSFGEDNIIDITSASLKNLSLIRPIIWIEPNARLYELNVACPNLVSLKVFNLELPKFSFQEMNSLQNLSMDLARGGDLFSGDLSVEISCHALSRTLKGFCNVKALEVTEVFLEPTFGDASRNIPNDPWKMPNATTCLKYHLKIVELFEVRDRKYELDLISFFLKNGHVLQKMRISWVEPRIGNIDKIISEIMKFPRSSLNVALTIDEPMFPAPKIHVSRVGFDFVFGNLWVCDGDFGFNFWVLGVVWCGGDGLWVYVAVDGGVVLRDGSGDNDGGVMVVVTDSGFGGDVVVSLVMDYGFGVGVGVRDEVGDEVEDEDGVDGV